MDETSKILETALLAGTILMESNAEAFRTEETMNFILQTADFENYSSIALTTAIFVMVYNNKTGERRTAIERIRHRSNNLYAISAVNDISRAYTYGNASIDETYESLVNLRAKGDIYPKWLEGLATMTIGVCFALIFGGGLREALAALVTGLVLVLAQALNSTIKLRNALNILLESLAVTLCGFILGKYVFPGLATTIVVIATLMPLVPGISIVSSFRDIFREDFLSGLARGTDAIYQSLLIALGTIIGYFVFGRFF